MPSEDSPVGINFDGYDNWNTLTGIAITVDKTVSPAKALKFNFRSAGGA